MDKYVCTYPNCNKKFKKPCKLDRHMLSHSNERKFVCQQCNNCFQRQDHLKRHLKIHTQQTHQYKCPYSECFSLGFIDNSHLKRHIVTMHENPHKCLICSTKFVKKIMLLKHMTIIHKQLPPFSCELCKKSIYSHGQYEHHIKKHEESKNAKLNKETLCKIAEESKEQPKCAPLYRCIEPNCLKVYTTKFNLKTHIRTYHNQNRKFKCKYCNEEYLHNISLKQHINKCHMAEPVVMKNEEQPSVPIISGAVKLLCSVNIM